MYVQLGHTSGLQEISQLGNLSGTWPHYQTMTTCPKCGYCPQCGQQNTPGGLGQGAGYIAPQATNQEQQ